MTISNPPIRTGAVLGPNDYQSLVRKNPQGKGAADASPPAPGVDSNTQTSFSNNPNYGLSDLSRGTPRTPRS